MSFRISPNFPGLERIDGWLQAQFNRFREAEVDSLFNGRRFTNTHLLDTETMIFRPVEEFGVIQMSAKENAATWGLLAFSYSVPYISAISIGGDVSTTATAAGKTNVYLDTNKIVIENNEGAGRTYHVSIV